MGRFYRCHIVVRLNVTADTVADRIHEFTSKSVDTRSILHVEPKNEASLAPKRWHDLVLGILLK